MKIRRKNFYITTIFALFITLVMSVSFVCAEDEEAKLVLEPQRELTSEQASKYIKIGMDCSYTPINKEILDEINKIRYSACTDGITHDPRNWDHILTEEDYVPIKWSTTLANIARYRAAEATISCDHRHIGDWYNLSPREGNYSLVEGIMGSGSVYRKSGYVDTEGDINTRKIASYGSEYCTNDCAKDGSERCERCNWNNRIPGAVTGHYTPLINPSVKYVGISEIDVDEDITPAVVENSYRDWCGGAIQFCFGWSDELEASVIDTEVLSPLVKDAEISLYMKTDYVKSKYIEGQDEIYKDDSSSYSGMLISEIETDEQGSLGTNYNTPDGTNLTYTHLKLKEDDQAFTSSDESVVRIDKNGKAYGVSEGTATITLTAKGEVWAKKKVTVKCKHDVNFTTVVEPTCSEAGYKEGVCSKCGRTIRETLECLPHNYEFTKNDTKTMTATCKDCGYAVTYDIPKLYECIAKITNPQSDCKWIGEWADYSHWQLPEQRALNIGDIYVIEGKQISSKYETYTLSVADDSIVECGTYSGENEPNKLYKDEKYDYIRPLKSGIGRLIVTPTWNPNSKREHTFICGELNLKDADEISLFDASVPYTGEERKNYVSIIFNGEQLSSDYYTCEYENNINVGTATITITGKGPVHGTIKKTFEITPNEISSVDYDGTIEYGEKIDNSKVCVYGYEKVDGNYEKVRLEEGVDYELTGTKFAWGVFANTATITVKGINNYGGTKDISCSVNPLDLSSERAKQFIHVDTDDIYYDGTSKTPKVTIDDIDTESYKVSYSDNVEVGTGTITIKAVSYSRQLTGSVTIPFEIKENDISTLDIKIADHEYNLTNYDYQNDGKITPAIVVNGQEYTWPYSGISDIFNIELKNNDAIGTGTAVITSNGYKGTVTLDFTIVQGLEAYSISLSKTEFTYNGKEHRPDVTIGSLVEGRDYDIKYEDNINSGYALVIATGKGSYTGQTSAQFYINEKVPELTCVSSITLPLNGAMSIEDLNIDTDAPNVRVGLYDNNDDSIIIEDGQIKAAPGASVGRGAWLVVTASGQNYYVQSVYIFVEFKNPEPTEGGSGSENTDGNVTDPDTGDGGDTGDTGDAGDIGDNSGTDPDDGNGGNIEGGDNGNENPDAGNGDGENTDIPEPGEYEKPVAMLELNTRDFTTEYGAYPFFLDYIIQSSVPAEFSSSNTGVVRVSDNGMLSFVGVGKAVITIKTLETEEFKAAEPVSVTVNVRKAYQRPSISTATKNVYYSKLKKKTQVTSKITVKNAKGTLKFTKLSGSSKIKMNSKTGAMTVKKGTKKGSYKIKFKVYSASTSKYNSYTKTCTVYVKVK